MKTLLLLRHANAEKLAPASSDFERGLNESGRIQARELGAQLKQQLAIDLVLSSAARRARETTELVLAAAELSPDIRYKQTMYETSVPQLLALVGKTADEIETMLLVGHNPVMEDLAQALTKRAVQMSTCALVAITLNVDRWSDVMEGGGDLERILRLDDLR